MLSLNGEMEAITVKKSKSGHIGPFRQKSGAFLAKIPGLSAPPSEPVT